MNFYQWFTFNKQHASAKEIWAAAQAEMQERCAKVCENFNPNGSWETTDLADAIRALDKEK